MGLLARASKEAQAGPSNSSEGAIRPSRGQNLPPPFDSVEAASLRSVLPGKADILAIKCLTSPKESLRGGESVLAQGLTRALGPDCKIYRMPGCVLAFASPSGDWDAMIFQIQLRSSLGLRIEAGEGEGLILAIGRFSRASSSFVKDLSDFIGA